LLVALESVRKYYRVNRKDIAFLKFIFESYEGLAVVSTVDRGTGCVLLHISPGCVEEAEAVIKDLGAALRIEPADPPC
jgi:hypothetical protein